MSMTSTLPMADFVPEPQVITNMRHDPNQRVFCIHHTDEDGIISALLLKTYFNNVFFIGTNYGKHINYNLIQPGSTVFIVDFALSVEEMQALSQYCTLVTIDHHMTLFTDEYKQFHNLEGIRSTECSAAKLVWRYFHPTEICPRSVTLVSDYDTWKFDNPDTLPFHYGIEMFNINPSRTSNTFLNKLLYNDEFVNGLIGMGKRIDNYIETKNKLLSDDGAFISEINGHKVLCMNIRNCNSKVLDAAAKAHPEIKLRSTFGYNSSIKKYKCSLYSDDKSLVVQDIDNRIKGHKSAGGLECELKDLPYKLPSHDLKEPNAFDFVSEIKRMNLEDDLIFKHDSSSLGYLCTLNGYPAKFEGMDVFAVNHPYWTSSAMYSTTLIMDYQAVVFWNLTASGWFRYRIYPLERNRLSLEDLANLIPGSKIVGKAVWCYRDAPLEVAEFLQKPLA